MRSLYQVGKLFLSNLVNQKKHALPLLFFTLSYGAFAQQATNINFQPVPTSPTSLVINWNNGGGVGRIVVVKSSKGRFTPVDNADILSLNASPAYANGAANDEDASGEVAAVVFAGTGSGPVTVAGLTQGAQYFVQVYEFGDASSSPDYNVTTNNSNPRGFAIYGTAGAASFTVPIDVSNVTVQAWGGGGGGGGANGTPTPTTERGGGGGSGGSYTLATPTVTGGDNISVTIGSGGSAGSGAEGSITNGGTGGTTSFASTVAVNAVGGAGGVSGQSGNDTGAGGGVTTGITQNGGAGVDAPGTDPDATSGGGGGGAAGTTASGNAASGPSGGSGGAGGGGSGANGRTATTGAGNAATQMGGGGGGAYTVGASGDDDRNGGAGAAGYMIVSFNDNTPPTATITRVTPSGQSINSSTTSVTFRVTFNEDVVNVNPADFALGTTNTAAGTIGTVTANPGGQLKIFDVQVTGITGSGDLDLNFGTHDIRDLSNNNFSGSTTGDQIYTRDGSAPFVVSIVPVQSPTRSHLPKTGTITASTASTNVTGVGTSFTTELFPGAILWNFDGTIPVGRVLSITSDTQLTLAAVASNNLTNSTYSIRFYFVVTFNEPIAVSTINTADFIKGAGTATGTNIIFAAPASVLPGPPIVSDVQSTVFNVSVDATGSGTWRLDKTNDAYQDLAGNSSTTTFTTGSLANIDNAAPTVTSINRTTPAAAFTQATSVTYTVTFAEAVTGVDPTDFTATVTGVTAGAITVNPISTTVYEVSVASISTVQGTLRLDVNANATITDGVGNNFGSTAYTSGQIYTFDYTNPAQPAVYNAVTIGGNVVANFRNRHNHTVRLGVAIPSNATDPTLLGGTIQVEARISSGSFATIASTSSLTITGGDQGTTKNIDIDSTALIAITGYAQGVQLQFQVRFVDLVGNTGTYRQSTNSLTVDTSYPKINGTPVFALNGSGRETIVLNFTEPLALANGVLPVRTATSGQPGFYSSQPFIRNSAPQTFYTLVGNTITLSSDADGNWTSAVQITYTQDLGVGGNYVRDAAGNEMATVTFPVTAPAPLIFSSMVLNPNGASGEIITFTVDQTLSATPTTANGVTGITVNGLSTGFTSTYSTTGNTITLQAAANNTWNETATVSYSAGNLGSTTAMAAFGPEPVLFGPVTIASNNTTNTAFATTLPTANTITITFRANAALSATPTVTIGGLAATVSGTHPNYTATLTATNAITQGVVAISINGLQPNRNTTTTFTTNSSTVTFDNIIPATPSAPDLAAADDSNINNDDITNVSSNLDFSGTAEALSTVRLRDGGTVIGTVVATAGNTYTFSGISLANGFHNLTVTSTDNAGNASTSAILKVKIDTQAPTVLISSITASTGVGANQTPLNGIGITQGVTGNVPNDLYFKVTFLEEVYNVATTDFNQAFGTGSVISSLGVNQLTPDVGNDSIFYVRVGGATGTGTLTLNLKDFGSIIDLAGNTATGSGDFTNAFASNRFFTLALPEPVNQSFTLTASNITGNSVDLDWNSTNLNQRPTHFLVLAKPSSGSYPTVADGTYINNGALAQNVVRVPGSNSYTFTGLNSGTSYDFIVYKYTLASNNSNDNINFETSAPASVNNIETTTAESSYLSLNSTPVPISSLKNTNLNSENVFSFKFWDDGQNPLATGMRLKYNGTLSEQIIFNLREELTVGEGANITGFTTSSGFLASAVYTGKGTTNTVTLTSSANGVWTSATTVTYSGLGNAQFVTLGALQPIVAHPVNDNVITQTFLSDGSFTVPASITNITVEAWGGGGSAGGLSFLANRGGGGGGGAYSRSTLSVSPGNNYGVTVGLGATCCFVDGQPGGTSSFAGLVVAVGGNGGFAGDSGASGGAGGSAFSGTGAVRFSGGPGASGVSAPSGGGGGSSAGTSSSGNGGQNTGVPGAAPVGGGAGGLGSVSGPGGNGQFPGGGGGGTGGSPSGLGANGQIIVSYDDPTLPPANSDWDGDNAPTKFSQLVINQGIGNSALLANWQDILAGAELFDGTNAVAGTINTNNITFSAIPSANAADVGFVPDANATESFKDYTLRVWLRNNLNNSIANAVDGSSLAFRIDPAGITYNDVSNGNQRSSRLLAIQPTLQSGANNISVVATKLAYQTPGNTPLNTNPQAQIGVGIPFSASSAQDPEVYALDANNNRDLNYNNSANITNPLQNFGQSTPSLSFNSGLLSLNPFFFTTGATTVQNTQLVVTGTGVPAVTPATSTNVAAIISSRTTITAATGGEPATLSSLTTALTGAIAPQQNAVSNFNFTLTDDAGANTTTFDDNDGLPTRFTQLVITQGTGNDAVLATWTNAIASAQLISGLSIVNGTVNANNITFGSIPNALASDAGFIADGGNKTYTLRIALRNSVDVSIADQIDNKDFVFNVATSNVTVGAANTTSVIQTAQSQNSGDGNNTVAVIATKLDFINPVGSTQTPATPQNYDANIDFDDATGGAQQGLIKARDVNQNRDLDINTPLTLAGFDFVLPDGRTYPLNNATGMNFTNGQVTLNANLQVSSTGGGFNADQTYLVASTGVISGNSATFTLNYSGNSDIALATFTEPTNILYADVNNQVNDITAGTGVTLQQFTIRDGGGSPDADGTATTLGSIQLNITNSANIRRIALYNGANLEVAEIAPVLDAFGNIVFSGLDAGTNKIRARDNRDTTFSVKVSFNNVVTDNQVLNVRVVNATAAGVSSSFNAGTNSTTFPTLATDANQIEVVATQIDFTTIPVVPLFTASISEPLSPQVVVFARDVNTSIDLDYNGAITANGTTPGGFNTINNPTGSFSNGSFFYPTNFQFDSGNGDVLLTLNAGAGSGGGVDAGALSGISNPIRVTTSFESTLISGFLTNQPIPYQNFQSSSIANVSNGFEIERLRLTDGASPGFNDTDGANTVLTGLTLAISNAQAIRTLAIFTFDPDDNTTNFITETSTITPSGNGYGLASFSGLNIVAEDKVNPVKTGHIELRIVATFENNSSDIVDNKQIRVAVQNATVGTGSKFPPAPSQPGTFIGGVATSVITLPDATATLTVGAQGATHFINVVATSLDFVTQPSALAGKNEPIVTGNTETSPNGATGIVHARDRFAIIDTDFNFPANVNAPANPYKATFPFSFSFSNGILDLTGLEYGLAGNGTLTIITSDPNSLNSNNTPWPTSIPCNPVNVIHVTADPNTAGVIGNGNPSASLKGGNTNQVIFGFTIRPEHFTPGSQPRLKGFEISFRNKNGDPEPFKSASRTTLKNPKIRMATVANPNAGSASSIAGIATITEERSPILASFGAPISSKDMIKVVFNPASYPALFNNAQPITLYLVMDVDVSANNATPSLQPVLVDDGFSFPATNKGIEVTSGSSMAFVPGTLFSFASTKPPVLEYSEPFNGQLNVDTTLSIIKLKFDVPVTTFDAQAILWDRFSGLPVDTLQAVGPGVFVNNTPDGVTPNLSNMVSDTLYFQVNKRLTADSVYYLTLAKGRFNINDHADRSGISDRDFNMFGGISFNGTLYFKAASLKPPDMTGTDASRYSYLPSVTVINASFNQYGKAYFMVVNQNDPAPTNAQIKGTVGTYTGTPVYRGTIAINQLGTNPNFGLISTPLTPNSTYDVWIYAENDASTPIPTSAPFGGGPDYNAGGVGPTIRFTVPSTAPFNSQNFFPNTQICANSSALVTDPIIFSEINSGDFSGGWQTINLLLPTGIKYDLKKAPEIQFIGSDFTYYYTSFENSSLLSINYENSGSSSLDYVVISNLYLIADGSDQGGYIRNFGGSAINVPFYFGYVSSYIPQPIEFSNSYSDNNRSEFAQSPIEISNTVTFIPNNYVDPSLNEQAVRLIPKPPKGDYGPSSFTGSGLTDDKLVLSAVSLDAAFNITMKHTDMNGCITEKVLQHTVYNSQNAIPGLGTEVCIVNNNFPGIANNPTIVADSVSRNGLSGFKLLELIAKVPTRATFFDSTATAHTGTDQILFGSQWNALIAQIPVLLNARYDSLLSDTTVTFNYNYDPILNARTLSSGVLPNPYAYFDERPTPRGKRPFKGGSLGKVEFTGKYQSTADFTVKTPIRQEVEVFIPAIPVVEEVTDASYIVTYGPGPENRTPIYCEGQTAQDIQIQGFPKASPGSSTGFFTVRDSATNVILLPGTGAFVDNGNGTAVLKSSFINQYRTIRIEYTYKDDESPCSSTGGFYLRITPNPTARFSASSPMLTDNIPGFTFDKLSNFRLGRPIDSLSLCEDNFLRLQNTSYFINTITGLPITGNKYVARTRPTWTLGDPTNARNVITTPAKPDTIIVKYQNFGEYIATLQVNSQYNCPSTVYSAPLTVGAIPEPAFTLTGISTADSVKVDAITSTVASGNGANSSLQAPLWNYGEVTNKQLLNRILKVVPNDTLFNYRSKLNQALFDNLSYHPYDTVGHFFVSLLSRSSLGCAKIITKEIIIVPDLPKASVGRQHVDDFSYTTMETPKRRWQTDGVRIGKNGGQRQASIWRSGAVKKDSINIDLSVSPDSVVWSTGLRKLTKLYLKGEKSYLYSSVYNFDNIQIERPMVSFDYINAMDVNDGVAFEYSVDNLNAADPLKVWRRVGTNATGVDWYDRSGLASKPGSQQGLNDPAPSGDYGWSNSDELTRTVDWANARHSLTRGLDIPNGQSRIMFRFAFSSLGDTTDVNRDEGFALDNFRIGDRSRVVLVESFFNTGKTDPAEKDLATFLQKDFNPTNAPVVDALEVGEDYIKLNYHVGFPTQDPFNLENPADPSSRALYYGVSATPNSRVDGKNATDYGASDTGSPKLWLQKAYDDRTLNLADAEISLDTLGATREAGIKDDGSYYVIPNIRAVNRLSDSTIVQVVFAEKKIAALPGVNSGQDSVYYVVQRMAPSASGTELGIDLLPGNSIRLDTIFFTPTVRHLPNGDMVAVVFLQNPKTRAVYQAAMVSLSEPGLITSVDDPLDPNNISVYPNPADDALNIILPVPAKQDVPVVLADQMGRITHQLMVRKGEQSTTLQTSGNSAGVYILQMDLGNGKVARKKIIINHRE